MVEGRAVVNLWIVVEDVGIEPRIHALSGTTRGEAASAAEKDLHCGQCVDVLVMNSHAFESDVEVVEFRRCVLKEGVTASIIR